MPLLKDSKDFHHISCIIVDNRLDIITEREVKLLCNLFNPASNVFCTVSDLKGLCAQNKRDHLPVVVDVVAGHSEVCLSGNTCPGIGGKCDF